MHLMLDLMIKEMKKDYIMSFVYEVNKLIYKFFLFIELY